LFYYLLPRKYRWTILLISSLIFYVEGGYQYIVFILITTCSVYVGGRLIVTEKTLKKKKG
jgi:alginate O-acetyltransferase complex protein AlgI